MIILGVDPGIARLGYGLVERSKNQLSYCSAGTVKTPAELPLAARLSLLWERFGALCAETPPDRIVLERLFWAPNRNLLGVSEARGIILLYAGLKNIPVEEISPTTLKSITTRSGRARKMQMQRTIQRMLNTPVLPPPDAADALALAILGSSATFNLGIEEH